MLGMRVVAVAVAAAALATGCGSGGLPTKPGVVRVVAAENFWGEIAEQIGGKHVEVTSIINDPNADPHLFESDPQTVAEVVNAQLVIVNGYGYDEFMRRLLATDAPKGRVVVTMAIQGEGPAPSNPNPHIWYATARLPVMADAIAGQLAVLDPADRAFFAAGAERFIASLQPVLNTIAAIKRKYAGTPVGYTERLPGYLVAAAGLNVVTPASFAQAIEDGNDPSPQDVVTFDSDITDHKIKVLIYNAQVVDAATTRLKQLGISSHVPVVGMTETMPPDMTFQSWQLRQDRALLRALGG